MGLGAFHSGVEVHGQEWTFASGGGIFSHAPKNAPGAPLRVSIRIGETAASSQEVATLVAGMRPDWPGSRYNVIKWCVEEVVPAAERPMLDSLRPCPLRPQQLQLLLRYGCPPPPHPASCRCHTLPHAAAPALPQTRYSSPSAASARPAG